MNEQHREVQAWLDQLYGGESVPDWEINHRTVGLLHDLMTSSQERERHTTALIDDLQQKAEEYSIQADMMSSVLSQLGLTPDALSQSGAVSLKTLASTSALLEVKDASTSSLLLALSDLSEDHWTTQEARREEQRLNKDLFSKTKAALLKSSSLKKVLSDLEEQAVQQGPLMTDKTKQAAFLQSKVREYRRNLQQSQLELAKSGVDPSVYHQNLVNKFEELKALREKYFPLKAKLDSYQKLPPDISLTKVKVEEAKRELAKLDEEINKNIDLMHM